MSVDVSVFCKCCTVCERGKDPPRAAKAPLGTVRVGAPFEVIAMDIMGPLPLTARGNKYILVVWDYFSKWVEILPLQDMRAETVAHLLVELVFMKFGVPSQLHSDQGPNFESRLMSCLCQLLGGCKTRTTPYRPQSDGLVERANRTIQVALRAYVEGDQASWDKHLSLVQFAYNTGVHRSTGFTPHCVLFGREARLPLDLFLPPPNTPVEAPLPVYVSNLRSSLGRAFGVVRDRLGVAHRVAKAAYDRRAKLPTVQPGDYVWLHAVLPPGSSPKLFRPWTGPWQVEVVKGVVCAIVRVGPPPSPRHAKHLTVHEDRLRVVQGKMVAPPGVPACLKDRRLPPWVGLLCFCRPHLLGRSQGWFSPRVTSPISDCCAPCWCSGFPSLGG